MIGERLKKVRGGMSQRDFADMLGTSQGYISDIEKGKKKPGAEFLISLKRFKEIDLDWLLTGEERGAIMEIPADPINAELLEAAIELADEVVEDVFRRHEKTATSKQKAQLVLALYDLGIEREDHKIDRPTALWLVKRMAA